MGDTKNTVGNPEIEPESSKNDEHNSQDANSSKAQNLRSMATTQKRRTTGKSRGSSNTLFIPNKDLLKVCKPISIRIIRLPDTVVNKCTQDAEARAKKKKKYRRKSDYGYDENRRKVLRRRKLQLEKAMLLKSQQSGLDEKGKNDTDQQKPEKVMAAEISNIPELATMEESPSGTSELPTQLIAVEENEVDESAECTKNSEINTEVSKLSELSESQSKIAAEIREISQNKQDQISFPEISDNIEICLATNIPPDLSNAVIDTAEILPESSPDVPPERNNNQNRKTSLQRHLKQKNAIRIQFVETRKRTLKSDDETEETQSHFSKRPKLSRSAELSEEIDTTEGKNNSESIKNSIPIVKQFTVTKVSRADPKSVRRRSIPTEKTILGEAKVVLCRLENSKDPLVLEWTRQNTLVRSNDITLTESRTSPVTSLVAVEDPPGIETVIAGESITSLEDVAGTLDKRFNEPEEPNTNQVLSETLDISKNGPEQPDTDVLSKKDVSAALEDEAAVPIACEETGNNVEEEDDDEIVRFLGHRRRVRSSIDSSSSASSSSTQTFVSTRVLRSKTPKMNGSFLENIATSPATSKTPRLRIRDRSTSTDCSNSEGINNHKEIPEILHQESTNTSLLREGETRESTTSRTSDSSETRQEPRRPPSSRRKACQVIRNETSLNDGKSLSGFLAEEKTSVSASINDSSNQDNAPNVDQNEAEIMDEGKNSSEGRTSNFVTCGQSQQNEVSLDSLTQANCDFSEIETATSSSCNEVLVARRKLTALKNAMVVLTRLEDLDGLSEDNKFTLNEIELKTTVDFEFSRSSTPDPLEMNKNDKPHSLRETENSTVPSLTGAVRVSPRKTLRSNVAAIITNPSIIQESPESEIEMHLGLEDAYSQETIESDVEMTLVLEENSSQEMEDSDAELLTSEDANRTTLATRDETESPDVVVLDVEKAAGSQDDELINLGESSSISTARHLPEGILTDANSNSGDTRNATIPDDYEGLDAHCKHCPCEEHKSDKRRLNCQNIPATHKCVTCRIVFKDAASLEAHKTTSTLCSFGFLCSVCQATFITHIEMMKHRLSCGNKVSQKQNSVDESTDVEETAEVENPPAANAESATKTNEKRENCQKVLSRRMRAKNRGSIDNLKCGVCSITFTTTQALSEHIFKHNTEELQEAYRIAKAKALEDSKTSKAASTMQKEKSSPDLLVSSIASIEANRDKSLPQELSAETSQLITGNVSVANRDSAAKSATVCLCHRDKHPACPDKTDLQIEMVLLCQYCMVIFRRRECFEIHYRTSPQCATDRTRGRSPKLYCANCQSTLNSWAGMRRHLEVHASLNVEGTVRFVCNICRVIFVGFGALFYNHWSSHLKDTMFVASRYSFPKNSVQPIDGIPKLPIGATPEESYILVAEHVCSNCKKPFSTRRDLEMHEKSKTCVETDDAGATEKQWHCDVCNQTYTSRRGLNKHSKAHHGQRFLCVATSPLTPAFMCTRCFAMRKLVVEIEDHWRTSSHHELPLGFIETEALTEKIDATGGAPDDANSSKNENQVSKKSTSNTSVDGTDVINSGDKSKTNNVETLIDISDSIEPEITCVFQSPTKTSEKQTACVNNQESQLASTNSNASSTPMLRNLLAPSPTMPDKVLRTNIRALEDPCVDIVLSEISKENVSAKLVINESRTNSAGDSGDRTNKDSYKIVMTPKQSSGNVTIVLDKTGSTESSEKDATKTTVPDKKDINEGSTANSSTATIVTANKPKLTKDADFSVESPINRDVSAKTPDTAGGKKNRAVSETSGTKKADSSISAWLNRRRDVPEIIDLSDEIEEVEATPTATPGKTSKPTRVITKNNAKTIASNKSGNSKSKKAVIKSKSPTKAISLNDSGTSNPDVFPFVLDTAEKSFEEVRFADYTRSKQLAPKDSSAAKKPGFLRVKNLSELQAIKIHNCLNCNSVFETPTALEEHYRSQLCTSIEKPPEYPNGMAGALILPDNSKATATQSLPAVYAAGNVVTQQLIGLDSGLGVISGVPVSSVIVNNETAGSWITVGGQHDSISSVALVNTTHSLSGGTLLMNLGDQQSANNNINNPSALMATSIATSTATIAQTQEFLAVQQQQQYQQQQQQQQLQQYQQQQQQQQYQQQQQQQQYQQQQQQYQQQPILGMNQQLSDNCNGQIGFHVMPAMVVPQTSQMNKQQCTDSAIRNTSIANLPISGQINNAPFTYHNDRANRYICSICSTFRCNSIGTMNSHVMKHYNGFNNPSSQNTTQSAAGGISNVGFQGAKDKSSQNVTLRSKGQDSNLIENQMKDGVYLRNTPQGFVWVTSMSTQMTNQQPGSSAGQDNSQINAGRSILRGGQIVYRCLICKCAMYKTYPPLRNHVVLVHGITDLISAGLDNIMQKIYLCTHCPHGAAMYDSEESHRQHVDSCHTNICPTCGRSFVTHHNLKMHLTTCSVAPRDPLNASDTNC